jgi:hypothetical protein
VRMCSGCRDIEPTPCGRLPSFTCNCIQSI